MKRGRILSPGEKLLKAQVAAKFGKMMEEKGAKVAAKELGVCLASFYKYVKGDDLPRFEVLKRAHKKWRCQFRYIDFDAVLPKYRGLQRPREEQYVLPFIESVATKDVSVIAVEAKRPNSLMLRLEVKFAS